MTVALTYLGGMAAVVIIAAVVVNRMYMGRRMWFRRRPSQPKPLPAARVVRGG